MATQRTQASRQTTKRYLLAKAQMLSISGQFFRAASTFPRDTYSPACNFTRSFLRSAIIKDMEPQVKLDIGHCLLEACSFLKKDGREVNPGPGGVGSSWEE